MSTFPRINRLTQRLDFQSVFANASKIYSHSFLALYTKNDTDTPRLGVSIRKHLVKHAVDRNRVKRIIKESFRHHRMQLFGINIVLLFRSNGDFHDKKALREEIDLLWKRLVIS